MAASSVYAYVRGYRGSALGRSRASALNGDICCAGGCKISLYELLAPRCAVYVLRWWRGAISGVCLAARGGNRDVLVFSPHRLLAGGVSGDCRRATRGTASKYGLG